MNFIQGPFVTAPVPERAAERVASFPLAATREERVIVAVDGLNAVIVKAPAIMTDPSRINFYFFSCVLRFKYSLR